MDLLSAPGAGDEELDLEDVAALVHAQDVGHPRTDPLEVFGGLDDPNEGDAAGGAGSVRVVRDEGAEEGDLVRDANAGGEEHDGTVGVEVLVAVGPFNEGFGHEAALGRVLGAGPELVGEAGAAADDQGHGGLADGEDVLALHGHALFGVDVLVVVGPGEGEGVVGPPADGGQVEVDVLAGLELPGTGDAEGHTKSIAGHSFDFGGGSTGTDVVADEVLYTQEALETPDDDACEDEELDGDTVNVHPQDDQSGNSNQDVCVQEDLVVCVANDRGGMEHEEEECAGTDGAGQDGRAGGHSSSKRLQASGLDLADAVCDSVSDCVEHSNTSQPPVHHVVAVERYIEQLNEEVVASCEKKEWNHVGEGQDTSSVADFLEKRGPLLVVV